MLISFRVDWLDLLAVQGTLKSLLQYHKFKSINSLALSLLYGPTHIHICESESHSVMPLRPDCIVHGTHVQLFASVQLFATQLYILYSPWNSPGQNTGMVSLSFLQGIFLTQGSNLDLLHCRRILYQLNHKGSPTSIHDYWKKHSFDYMDLGWQSNVSAF